MAPKARTPVAGFSLPSLALTLLLALAGAPTLAAGPTGAGALANMGDSNSDCGNMLAVDQPAKYGKNAVHEAL